METENESKSKKKISIGAATNALILYVIILAFEIIFRILMKYENNLESYLNILTFTGFLVGFIGFIHAFMSEKISKFFMKINLFIFWIMFGLQGVFYHIFHTYFSFSSLEIADQVNDFGSQAFSLISKNILLITLFFLPFLLFLILNKKFEYKDKTSLNKLSYLLIAIASTFMFISGINNDSTSRKLYYEVNVNELNYEKFGVVNSYCIDLFKYITGFEEKTVIEVSSEPKYEEIPIVYEYNVTDLDFEKATSNQKIKEINEYLENEQPTSQNEYTGKFAGYNLIYITAESFYETAISEELTPTLYKMTHSGFIFNNYYTPNVLSTIGGEFQSLTGLYPTKEVLSTWRQGYNYFPYGLGTVFKELEYETFAYHDHYYTFQDRHKYLRTQGFNNFLAVGNGMEKRINSHTWPESDIEMMEGTVTDYINSENPFLAYYMTVSGHMEYNFNGGNYICLKNKDLVQDLDMSKDAKAYVATQIELDRALEKLISELENAGKLDNTVFVLLADHYPYALSNASINSMSSYERDPIVETNHNALIIWNSQMENIVIDKTCMSVDVLPTVLNLFGVKYDSRLFTGKDILSDSEGLAIMENRSWVTDKGTYFSASQEFKSKDGLEVSEDYIERISNIVQNRINIAKWIIKNNYYNYLMK